MYEDMWILNLVTYIVAGLIVFVPFVNMAIEHIKRKNDERKGLIRVPTFILVKYYNLKEES